MPAPSLHAYRLRFQAYCPSFFFYFFSKRLVKDETLSKIAIILLITSVPFLLYIRQARYYALLPLATIWMMYSYLNLLENKKGSSILFVVSSAMLFYSNYLVFIGTLIGMVLYHIGIEYKNYDRKRIKRFVVALGGAFLAAFPWLFYTNVGGKGKLAPQLLMADFPSPEIITLIFNLSYFFVPIIFLPLIYVTLRKQKELYLSLFVISSVIFSLILTWPNTRYVIGIIPLLYLVLAFPVKCIYDRNKTLGVSIILLLVFTNIFSTIPMVALKITGISQNINFSDNLNFIDERSRIYSPFFDYLYTITHEFDMPIRGGVEYLKTYGNANDVVLTNFDPLTHAFYTNMKVINVNIDKSFYINNSDFSWEAPNWVLIYNDNPMKESYTENIVLKNYNSTSILYYSVTRGSLLDPIDRRRMLGNELNVTIYKKRQTISS